MIQLYWSKYSRSTPIQLMVGK